MSATPSSGAHAYEAPGPVHRDGGPGGDAGDARHDVGEVGLGELIGDVTRDLSTLVRQEMALARAELKREATRTGRAAGALGAAGFAGYMVLLFLSVALWWGLSHLIGHAWSALVVALLWGVVAAALYVTGRKQLREVRATPERTVDTVSHVPDALRGHRGGTP